jgi:hypothetical protein
VLFAYTEKHTQEFVKKLFGGFKGYLQCDASNVYDILDRGPPRDTEDGVTLVGCFAHCRRYFFEAAICKYAVGVQGLMRIRAIYAADDAFRKLPPAKRKLMRDQHIRPLIDSFFDWVKEARAKAQGRNLATKALGYALNQEQELRRVLDDGRLPLDNTRSERSLRKIVVGRKNWMFYGSDTHAESAAAIFTIIASCRCTHSTQSSISTRSFALIGPNAQTAVSRACAQILDGDTREARCSRARRTHLRLHHPTLKLAPSTPLRTWLRRRIDGFDAACTFKALKTGCNVSPRCPTSSA